MYKPTALSLYLTQYCPLKCKYCIFGTQEKQHMPNEYAIKRIREAKELKVSHVVFTGGEPTLHPDFLEIFKEIKNQNMSVLLVTNGIPIKEEILKEVTDYEQSTFYFSLDCHDKKINDKYRDEKSFDYVVKTIEKIRDINSNKFIGVNSILLKETLEQLPKTTEFILNELKANTLSVERVIRVGNSEKIPDEWIIKDMKDYFKTIEELKQKYQDRFRCYTCDLHSCLLDNLHSFNILAFPDKKINLCCNLPDKRLKIGDENNSLKDILKEENIKKTAKLFNKCFFKNQTNIRTKKGIFGCVECVEEYKKLRDSGELDNIIKLSKQPRLKEKLKQKAYGLIDRILG